MIRFHQLIAVSSSLVIAACSGGNQPPSSSPEGNSAASEDPAQTASRPAPSNAASPADPAPSSSPASIVKEGRIALGVECPVLHTPDGEIWALAAASAKLDKGAYVRVHGQRAEMSICQQGKGTIDVNSVEPAQPPARDRDPARAGGLAVTSEYVVGRWAAKGGDCRKPDFTVSTNSNGMALIKARVNGRQQTGAVDVGATPQLHWDEPLGAMAIETRGPDGLAVMPPESGPKVTIGSAPIRGDGVVFVKCA